MDLFSIQFVFFLSITFVVYYFVGFVNKRIKKPIIPQWFVLLIASLIFYGFTNYVYLIYLGISFFVSYFAGVLCQYKIFQKISSTPVLEYELNPKRVTDHLKRKRYENIITALSIIVNVGILAVLKYYNFFASSVSSIFHFDVVTYNFIIPLGISFYTFSLISYNVDCCKRTTQAETNPFKFLLYVSYFPKILQGPISSYDELKKNGLFKEHNFKNNDYINSFFRISIGLIKKIAIANVFNLCVNASYQNISNMYGGGLLLTSILYTIQLYCDFSGFADITIGISGLFGIKLEENFNTPYISKSISEFWRRWHITLGAWLRKYIYIPLGGNKVSVLRWVLNTLIVWLVSGIWHGANWTFIVWGLLHGILIVINGLPKKLKKIDNTKTYEKPAGRLKTIFSIVGTFLLVNLGWIFFRSTSINEAGTFIFNMVQFWKPSTYSMFADSSISKANWLFVLSWVSIVLLIVIKIITIYENKFILKFKNPNILKNITKYLSTIMLFSFAIFVFIYLYSIGGGESSFIYFDF